VEKGTYACEGYIICSILPISVGGTTEDSRAELVLIPMNDIIRMALHGWEERAVFDKEYD